MAADMEARIAQVEREQGEFRQVVRDIRDISERQAESLETLVRLEERQAESRQAVERAFGELASQRKDVDAIKIVLPQLMETRKWVVTGMVALVGMVLLALVGMVLRGS